MPKVRKPAGSGRLMSQSAAARTLGVSRPTVVAMIARGELEAELGPDDVPAPTRASVEKLAAARATAAA